MDAVNIVRLLTAGYQEGPIKYLAEMSELQLLEYVTQACKRAFSLVAEHSGRLLGAVALVPINMPWHQVPVMAEAWLAVRPEQRERGLANELLQQCETFLDQAKLPMILGTNALVPPCFDTLIEPRGYMPLRAVYLRLPVTPT